MTEILDIASGVLLVVLAITFIVWSQYNQIKIERLDKEIEENQKKLMRLKCDYFDKRGIRKGDVFTYGERALLINEKVENHDVEYIDYLPCRLFIPKADWENYLKIGEVSAILDKEEDVQERVVEQQG